MTDSSSFSSLMALVDSHLSQTSLKAPDTNQAGTVSDTHLSLCPTPRLPLPTLSLTESPIKEVLAMQVSNMLKSKEEQKRKDEEETRLAKEKDNIAEQIRKLKLKEDSDSVIDLVKAVKESMDFKKPLPTQRQEETLSSTSSFESLFGPQFMDCDQEADLVKTPEPLLPCQTDMSYISKEKVRRGRCSSFGKVLTSRLKPVAAPYFKDKTRSKVVRFDFSTKSPCDLIKEKLRQPKPKENDTPDFDFYTFFPDLKP